MSEGLVHVSDDARALTPGQVMGQVARIQEIMTEAMREGEHWGKIPGCGPKPVLLKSGAEKLALTFRLDPRYEVQERYLEGGHIDVVVNCDLYSINSGKHLGSGLGSCSTLESKYRYRQGERKCPKCGEPKIIRGKAEYGGGWLCFKKVGGCGAKFRDGDAEIESQETGRGENPDIADTYNTVRKMAKKRAFVDATLTVTAASDIFTQDLEETEPMAAPEPPAEPVFHPELRSDEIPAPSRGDSRGGEEVRSRKGRAASPKKEPPPEPSPPPVEEPPEEEAVDPDAPIGLPKAKILWEAVRKSAKDADEAKAVMTALVRALGVKATGEIQNKDYERALQVAKEKKLPKEWSERLKTPVVENI